MQKSSYIVGGLIIILLAIVVVTSLKTKGSTSATIKIGVMAPLTGPGPALGEWMRDGALLAQKEINEGGGINGHKIELVIEDDACDGRKGVDIYHKLRSLENINYFVGPLCGAARVPVLETAKSDKTVIITTGLAFVSNPPPTTVYTFNVLPSAWSVAQKIAEFGKEKGYRKISILYTGDEYGKENALAFRDYATKNGIEIPTDETYLRGTSDMRTQILKLKGDSSEAVFVSAYGPDYAVFIKQARELGLQKKILAQSTLQVPEALVASKGGEQTFYYSYPAVSSDEVVQSFAEKYYSARPDKTKSTFLPMYIGSGYDALMLLAKALRECSDGNSTCVNESLRKTKDYAGANGPITFNAIGNNENQSAIEIRTLKNGVFERI